jgi:Arc/MetJ-type ribon-helix-helix transcriptional regulator
MTIHLTKESESFVDRQVKIGNFPDRQSVVEAALRILQEVDSFGHDEVEPTADDVAEMELSRQEVARGEFIDFDDFSARMREKYGISK